MACVASVSPIALQKKGVYRRPLDATESKKTRNLRSNILTHRFGVSRSAAKMRAPKAHNVLPTQNAQIADGA